MSKFVKTTLATAVMGAALAAASTAGAATIANTKHNFSGTGPGPNNTTGTNEICIFCHTPHGGDNTAPVPLWNKQLTTSTFKTYDQLGTSTLDAAVTSIGSVSLACLTCHDGSQAIDNIINAPGSGGYDPTGGGTNGQNWAWTSGDGSLDTTTGIFNPGPDTGGTVIYNIGTDLTNDHPVSVQYGGGGVSASFPSGGNFSVTNANGLRDADFKTPDQIGTGNRWYIDNNTMAGNLGSVGGAFDKWDFKLYTRTVTGTNPNNGAAFAGEPEPFVECGSCHDPHLETTTFLRIDPTVNPDGNMSNAGSRVCLTCHTK
jgi:hypothetical protein